MAVRPLYAVSAAGSLAATEASIEVMTSSTLTFGFFVTFSAAP